MELDLEISPLSREGEFEKEYDLIVIGGGPAGVASAIYAARKNLKTLLIERNQIGGTVVLTTTIENYPGFPSIQGRELAKKFEKHLESLGVPVLADDVREIKRGKAGFLVEAREEYKCKAIIIATGTKHRMLGVPGERDFIGKGVSYCATCDGPFFKGGTLAVVGGGNTAVKDALYLSELARKVYLIHRRDSFRADEIDVDRLKNKKNVEFVLDSVVKRINGDEKVRSIIVENVKTGKRRELDLDGVFIAIGETPNSELAEKLGVALDERGRIKVNERMETNVPGIHAAGDVVGGLAQIVTAAAEGAMAAISAYEYIRKPYWAKNKK